MFCVAKVFPQLIDSGIKDDSEHSFRVCLKELVQRLLVIFLIGLIEHYFMNCQVIIFFRYITEEYDNLTIHEVVLNKSNQENNQQTLDEFFQAHPKAVLGIVFNSRVYQLGEYLRHAEHSMKGLIGYDLLKANVDLLKSGDVHYLIGQRPGLQGYCGVKALCDHVVFKKSVDSVKYMPIDILIKENIDFYFEFV